MLGYHYYNYNYPLENQLNLVWAPNWYISGIRKQRIQLTQANSYGAHDVQGSGRGTGNTHMKKALDESLSLNSHTNTRTQTQMPFLTLYLECKGSPKQGVIKPVQQWSAKASWEDDIGAGVWKMNRSLTRWTRWGEIPGKVIEGEKARLSERTQHMCMYKTSHFQHACGLGARNYR